MNKVFVAVIYVMVLIGVVCGSARLATTDNGPYRQARVQMLTLTVDNDWPYVDMSDVTFTTNHIQGTVTRIQYDSNGTTDFPWSCVLKDTAGYAIFTKTDCNSTLEPLAYAIYEDDTEGNPHRGVDVSGSLSLDIDDVNQLAEVQTCTAPNDADAGTYTITIDGQTTNAMAYDDAVEAIDANLEALSNIGTDGVTSVVSTLDAGNSVPIVITFVSTLGNVPTCVFEVTDTNTGVVAVVETTQGGNILDELIVYIWYEQ